MKTRLRVGRAIAKTEEEVAPELMKQVKRYAPDEGPPAMSTDGKGAYREAMLEIWGKVPEYRGRGASPTLPQPGKDWQYLQVIKKRKGRKLESVRIKVIYGDEDEVKAKLGCHTAYVERTHLTSRTMNGRLVRKTLSFSKELRFLKAASALEDAFCAPRCAITTKMGKRATHTRCVRRRIEPNCRGQIPVGGNGHTSETETTACS